jgi:hypothetical protein
VSGTTDIAALSEGVVAVALSMFGEPGPYDPTEGMIGVCLILLFATYVIGRPRPWYQSLAVASVVALSGVPVLALVWQLVGCGTLGEWAHVCVWLPTAGLVMAIERTLQPRNQPGLQIRTLPIEQHFGVLEVGGIGALGEPAVDRRMPRTWGAPASSTSRLHPRPISSNPMPSP